MAGCAWEWETPQIMISAWNLLSLRFRLRFSFYIGRYRDKEMEMGGWLSAAARPDPSPSIHSPRSTATPCRVAPIADRRNGQRISEMIFLCARPAEGRFHAERNRNCVDCTLNRACFGAAFPREDLGNPNGSEIPRMPDQKNHTGKQVTTPFMDTYPRRVS
jgi:hypothetical protein